MTFYSPFGDIPECDKWLPWAKSMLARQVPPVNVYRPVENVEVMCNKIEDRVMITAGGEPLVTVADRLSIGGSEPDYDFDNPPWQSRTLRWLYKNKDSRFSKEEFFAGGNSASYEDVIFRSSQRVIGAPNDILPAYSIPIYSGGFWQGNNKALSWRDDVGIETGTCTFYIGGKYFVADIDFNYTPASPENAIRTRIVAACHVGNSLAIKSLYPNTEAFGRVVFALWNVYDKLIMTAIGVNDNPTSSILFKSPVNYREVTLPAACLPRHPPVISGFAKDGKTLCCADLLAAPEMTQKAWTIKFSEDYDTHVDVEIYSAERGAVSSSITGTYTVADPESVDYDVYNIATTESLADGSPTIIHIKPEGNGFYALRSGYTAYSSSTSSVQDALGNRTLATSFSSSGYFDVVNLTVFNVLCSTQAIIESDAYNNHLTNIEEPLTMSRGTSGTRLQVHFYSPSAFVYTKITENYTEDLLYDPFGSSFNRESAYTGEYVTTIKQGIDTTVLATTAITPVLYSNTSFFEYDESFSFPPPHAINPPPPLPIGASGSTIRYPVPHAVYAGGILPEAILPQASIGAYKRESFVDWQRHLVQHRCGYSGKLMACCFTHEVNDYTLLLDLKSGNYELQATSVDLADAADTYPGGDLREFYPIGLTQERY